MTFESRPLKNTARERIAIGVITWLLPACGGTRTTLPTTNPSALLHCCCPSDVQQLCYLPVTAQQSQQQGPRVAAAAIWTCGRQQASARLEHRFGEGNWKLNYSSNRRHTSERPPPWRTVVTATVGARLGPKGQTAGQHGTAGRMYCLIGLDEAERTQCWLVFAHATANGQRA